MEVHFCFCIKWKNRYHIYPLVYKELENWWNNSLPELEKIQCRTVILEIGKINERKLIIAPSYLLELYFFSVTWTGNLGGSWNSPKDEETEMDSRDSKAARFYQACVRQEKTEDKKRSGVLCRSFHGSPVYQCEKTTQYWRKHLLGRKKKAESKVFWVKTQLGAAWVETCNSRGVDWKKLEHYCLSCDRKISHILKIVLAQEFVEDNKILFQLYSTCS